jgi:glycosyltransferase involved in cell wall biosynthesis
MRQADRLVILSESLRPDMRAQGFDDACVDVIPHGEFSYYSKISEEGIPEGDSERRYTLLFFGRLREYKGLRVLVQAFPLIQERVPQARLLVVTSGDLRPYTAALAALRNVELVNRFIPDDEVGSWFARAGILVLPYLEASQSGVITIAYTRRMPVVATAVGGLREQVEDGVSGYLVAPGDPRALAERCADLMLDERVYRSMADGAEMFARTRMNWDAIADLTLATFERAIAARGD